MEYMNLLITKIKLLLRTVLWFVSPAIFRRVVKFKQGQVFSIGVVRTSSSLDFNVEPRFVNPVLCAKHVTDVPAAFVADPFLFRMHDKWLMFFEVFSLVNRLGQIAVATSIDGISWRYQKIVLREKFHLAYPYVFSDKNEIFMIPDSPGNGVRLYKAIYMESDWEYVCTLIEGDFYSDSSVFFYENKWWMLTGRSDGSATPMSLCLYYASEIQGPWIEHCKSPLIHNNDSISRPGGRVTKIDGKYIRFAQDGVPKYGSSLRAFKITELSENTYAEQELSQSPILNGSGCGWNAGGMHHIDLHKTGNDEWLCSIDGWYALNVNRTSMEKK